MEYKAEAIYDEIDFIGFMKAYTHKDDKLRGMEKVSKISAKAAGAILVIAAVINFMSSVMAKQFTIALSAMQAVMLLAGLALLRLPVDSLSGKRMWRQYEGQGSRIGFCFYPDYYVETRQGNQRRMEYSGIQSFYEDEGRFYLFVSADSANIICKDSFLTGDPEGFGQFIESVAGVELVGL